MNSILSRVLLALLSTFAWTSYAHQEDSFNVLSSDQINLHLKHYRTEQPNNFNQDHVILYIQGQSDATSVAEHFLVDCLENLNINVVSYDVRGQGASDGERAHVDDFYDHLDDLANILNFVQAKLNYKHVHFITHSTGGLIATLFASVHRPMLSDQSSLILVAPYFGLSGSSLSSFGIDLLTYFLSFTPAKLWRAPKAGGQGLYTKSDGSMNNFSSDPQMFQNYKNHPDKCGRPTLGWVQASLEAHRIIEEEAENLQHPILMFTAAGDQVVSTSEAKRFYEMWENTSAHNTYIEFAEPNQHGLIYEREETRSKMISAIGHFIDNVTKATPITRHQLNPELISSMQNKAVLAYKAEQNTTLMPKVKRKKSLNQLALYPAFFLFIPFATVLYLRRKRTSL